MQRLIGNLSQKRLVNILYSILIVKLLQPVFNPVQYYCTTV